MDSLFSTLNFHEIYMMSEVIIDRLHFIGSAEKYRAEKSFPTDLPS